MDNIEIKNCYLYTEREIIKILNKHQNSEVMKNRGIESLLDEWAVHKVLYLCGILIDRTCDADLNFPQKRIITILYSIFGRFFRIFL